MNLVDKIKIFSRVYLEYMLNVLFFSDNLKCNGKEDLNCFSSDQRGLFLQVSVISSTTFFQDRLCKIS